MNNLEKPETVRKLWIGFIMILAALAGGDALFVHHHGHFGIDETPAFFSWYGFITCVAMVLIAKFVVGAVLKRKDTYYDDE